MSAFKSFVIPPVGIVKLSDKQTPVCERETFDEHYAFTRGIVDVTAFKNKLANLPPGVWEDENQEGNVKLTRPAHDAWGIKKIIFTFCDDFLVKVLDLPWSQLEEWRSLLLPIYHAIGIDESKVVRSLLASMPPGVSIPVHHDTGLKPHPTSNNIITSHFSAGYWVKHCHRVHVAIDTGDEVDFMVGPTDDLLQKVLSCVCWKFLRI
jgi:hypothetical protein